VKKTYLKSTKCPDNWSELRLLVYNCWRCTTTIVYTAYIWNCGHDTANENLLYKIVRLRGIEGGFFLCNPLLPTFYGVSCPCQKAISAYKICNNEALNGSLANCYVQQQIWSSSLLLVYLYNKHF
jgi:hypothetical protein